MAKINAFSTEIDGRIDVSQAVGSKATAMYIYDVPRGGSSSPYHYEYEEEWLLVLEGTLVLRPTASIRSSAATSSVFRPVLPERTNS